MIRTSQKLYADYNSHNPFRAVRWRYERVMQLLEDADNRPNARRDDKYITAVFKFLRDWNTAGNAPSDMIEDERLKLFPKNPGLYYAYEIANHVDEDLKHVIEARILAKQSNKAIAARAGVTPDTVEWYEKVFFNVRDRLSNRDYISKQVIGPTVGSGLPNLTTEMTAKFFGYFGGPIVLDFVVEGYDAGAPLPKRPEDLQEYFDHYFASTLRRRSAAAINVFEINRFNVMQLFEVHARLIEAAQKAELGGLAKTSLEENVGALLETVSWTVGRERREHLKNSPLNDYMGHTAEPRADDLLQIAAGNPPDRLKDIAERKMPKPQEIDE
jgi:hypothetical protein|tara:strand:- start:858 stop:1841 length:984 start_codon:yes stop_codon:yes gene_type:complete